MEDKQKIANLIYNMLMSQSFVEWYEDIFGEHVVEGSDKEAIIEDIIELANL